MTMQPRMSSKEIFAYGKTRHTPEELLSNPNFSHVRFDEPWECFRGTDSEFRFGTFKVYFRCSDSPSGVLMAGSFFATDENKALLHARHLLVNNGPSRGTIAAATCTATQY